jgi:hypothetical protein
VWVNLTILIIVSGGLHNWYEESEVCHTKTKLMQSFNLNVQIFSDITPKQTTPKIQTSVILCENSSFPLTLACHLDTIYWQKCHTS